MPSQKNISLFGLVRWGLVSAALYFASDFLTSEVLMILAKKLNLSEINREIFVWLRAPISLYISLISLAMAGPWLFLLKIPCEKIKRGKIVDRIGRICRAH